MNNEKNYIPVKDLKDFLPHRDPMIWIDLIKEMSDDSGCAIVFLKKENLYFQNGVLLTSALIEFIAQSYGYLKVIEAKRLNKKIKLAFLSSIDHFELTRKELPIPGETLKIKIQTVKALHPIYLIKGHITNQRNEQICEIKIKGFAIFEGEHYET